MVELNHVIRFNLLDFDAAVARIRAVVKLAGFRRTPPIGKYAAPFYPARPVGMEAVWSSGASVNSGWVLTA
jgi:hypothetical protein